MLYNDSLNISTNRNQIKIFVCVVQSMDFISMADTIIPYNADKKSIL